MLPRRLALVLVALAAVGVASGGSQSPVLFEFRVGFWNSLHHHLHAVARPRPIGALEVPAEVPDAERLRAAWARSVAYYGPLGRRSLLFDDGLVSLSQTLSAVRDDNATLAGVDMAEPTRVALTEAAPTYRALVWPIHERAARALVDRVTPLLDRHGTAIASRLVAAYGVSWPAWPVPVDLVGDAGPPGDAHTAVRTGAHVTFGVADRRRAGLAVIEILFHEASHGWDARLQDAIARAAWARNRVVRSDLWHAVQFFIAGEATRRGLASAGVAYVPYAEVQGLTTGVYETVWPGVVRAWTPVLDGTLSIDAAADTLVQALGQPPPGNGR